MISHEYKCIFVEVPKTGSSSIRDVIGEPPKPHLNIWQIRDQIDPERFDAYFKFGFVRNPWDRVVSLYERKEGLQLRDQMSFEEFVKWIKCSSSTCIYPVPHRYQLDWFVDPHGSVILNYIGKFETLNMDWNIISGKLGIKKQLPHIKSNPREKHYTEYYTEKTRQIIEDKFRIDIEYFGYEFR